VVDGTGLENRRGRNVTGGSNPSPSDSNFNKILKLTWRDDREADGARLLIECMNKNSYRGFESPSLRSFGNASTKH
jgi:hypothetical protein